jgi:hypothetical protein
LVIENRPGQEAKALKRIQNFVSSLNTPLLVGIPFLIGLAVGIISSMINKRPYIPNSGDLIITVWILLLWGLSGLALMIRGEIPLPPPLYKTKGVHVKIIGFFITMTFWGLAILPVVKSITHLFRK